MRDVLLSLKNAFIGLRYCFITQRNMVIHLVFGITIIIVALFFNLSIVELLFIVSAVVLVLVAESFNTAVEKTIDLYTKDWNHLARVAKDVAAGAVLLTSIYAVIIGILILGPPAWELITIILAQIFSGAVHPG